MRDFYNMMSELKSIVASDDESLDAMMGELLSLETSLNQVKRHAAAKQLKFLLLKAAINIKEMLAEQILMEGKVPTQLYLALAQDDCISVAKPILEKATCFDEEDWQHVVDETPSSHWQVLATRADLSDRTLAHLIDQKDEATLLGILDNSEITLDTNIVQKLKHMSFEIKTLSLPLAVRGGGDEALISQLYWTASTVIAGHLKRDYGLESTGLDEALQNLTDELIEAAHGRHHVTPEIKALAARYAQVKGITPSFMNQVLKRGQVAFFIALFSEKTKLDAAFIQECVYKKSGKVLAALCKSNGVMKAEFASFYLLTRKSNEQNSGVEKNILFEALEFFSQLKIDVAEKLIYSCVQNPELIQ